MLAATGVSLAVADAVWAEIKSGGRASDDHLSMWVKPNSSPATVPPASLRAASSGDARLALSSLWRALSPRSLETLFGKNMLRACKIVDEHGVRRVIGAPSGRSLFLVRCSSFLAPHTPLNWRTATWPCRVSGLQVMGESRRKEEYLCFPEHLCTCYSFFYDIVGRSEQLCVSALDVTL
jgi:hypothetical protein